MDSDPGQNIDNFWLFLNSECFLYSCQKRPVLTDRTVLNLALFAVFNPKSDPESETIIIRIRHNVAHLAGSGSRLCNVVPLPEMIFLSFHILQL